MQFSFGSEYTGIHISVDPGSLRDGLVFGETTVSGGSWKGRPIGTVFEPEALALFKQELEVLYKNVRGEASFESLEVELNLKLTGSSLGAIQIEGTAVDGSFVLNFSLETDQTALPAVIEELRKFEVSLVK